MAQKEFSSPADPDFDAAWYLQTYPDVSASGLTAADHFQRIGRRLGRPGTPADATGPGPEPAFEAPQAGDDPFAGYGSYSVDIIIPVYNALADVKNCLYSILWHRSLCRLHVIIVDDGSEPDTAAWLERMAKQDHGPDLKVTLLRKEQNEGYTRAINSGLARSDGDFVVTQNSDTIVTHRWIERLIRCMLSDPTTGIVGPLSNAASWQNVPDLRGPDGSFAINALPEGMTAQGMAHLVARSAQGLYPTVPFVNGFCFMISRAVIDRIGHMDDVHFPIGYGEENDFCIRALNAGFTLRIADDAYVFHAKSKSFGHSKRSELSKAGSDNLRKKHGSERVAKLIDSVKNNAAFDSIRQEISSNLKTLLQEAPVAAYSWMVGQRVVFVLPVTGGGGGGHSVFQEVCAMRALGIEARIAIPQGYVATFAEKYPATEALHEIFLPYVPETFALLLRSFDCVVGTVFTSIATIARHLERAPGQSLLYYAQDYEPMFFEKGSARWVEALESYVALPQALIFSKTDWIGQQVAAVSQNPLGRVMASIDHTVYRPRARPGAKAQTKLTVSAMIRPATPYRGAERTMALLQSVKRHLGDAVTIRIFGCPVDDPFVAPWSATFAFQQAGVLTREGVAGLLQDSDLFLDLSDYQAFGRTGIEAMACGCALVSTRHGGVTEYIVDGENAALVDPFDAAACLATVLSLLQDEALLARFKMRGLQTAARYTCHRAALSELELFSRHHVLNTTTGQPERRTCVTIVPSTASAQLDKIAYTGTAFVRLLYPYLSLEGHSTWATSVSSSGRLPAIRPGHVALLQRDLLPEDHGRFDQWAAEWKAQGGAIVYDIDDDLLDGAALTQRGYAGDATALGQRVRNYCQSADIITVSTTHLTQVLKEYRAKIRLVPNFIDANLWKLGTARKPRTGTKIKIGYVGTPTHHDDLALVVDAIRQIEADHDVSVEVIGAFQNSKPLFGTKIGLPRNSIYPVFSDWLLKVADWDIALIPLADSSFNRSKSNLKFLECSALGAAILCSDTAEYRRVARDGDNCLMVRNTTEDWVRGLQTLIGNAALRQRLADKARADLVARLTIQRNRHVYDAVLQAALAAGQGRQPAP